MLQFLADQDAAGHRQGGDAGHHQQGRQQFGLLAFLGGSSAALPGEAAGLFRGILLGGFAGGTARGGEEILPRHRFLHHAAQRREGIIGGEGVGGKGSW